MQLIVWFMAGMAMAVVAAQVYHALATDPSIVFGVAAYAIVMLLIAWGVVGWLIAGDK